MGVAPATGVADVATRLRSARERAGLSIDQFSARTKIKPSTLIAIERGAFDQLPGEFFTRAFLRTYARELHLPVDEVMADYDGERPPSSVKAEPTPPPRRVVADDSSRFGAWPLAAGIAAVLVVLFVITRPGPELSAEPSSSVPVATLGTTPPVTPAAIVPTTGSKTPESLRIEILPTRRLWVTASADGTRVLFRMLEPGETVSIEARDSMQFRVGDAGAFAYRLNGIPGKPPGRSGEVREFTIDRNTLGRSR